MNTTLIIHGSGKMDDYSSETGKPWEGKKESITSVKMYGSAIFKTQEE